MAVMSATEPKQEENASRKSHYLPVWHQAGFSRGTQRKLYQRSIWRYDKRTDQFKPVPIRHSAVIKDYYSVEREDGTLDHSFEPMFAEAFDGPGSGFVRKLLRREPLTVDERSHFSAYVAFQHGRVPVAREAAFQMMSKVETFMQYNQLKGMSPQEFVAHARERGLEGTDDELAEKQVEVLAQLKSGEIFVGPDEAATMISATAAVEAVSPILFGMHWTILQAPIGFEFVIGDSPVTRYSEMAATTPRYRYGIGFGGPDVEVYLPLTMNHTLLMTNQRSPKREHMCSPDAMRSVNAVAWRSAQRYVLASCEATLRRVASYFETAEDRRQSPGEVEISGADLD
jgi:hypothetical protein